MHTRYFQEKTTNPVEQQNAANKSGWTKTAPSMSLDTSAKKMVMKSRATQLEKSTKYCLNVDKSNLWSNSSTSKKIINNVEGLIRQYWSMRSHYRIIQISQNEFWMCSLLFQQMGAIKKFERVRRIIVGNKLILCSCCCFEQNGYPCTHIVYFAS